MFWVDFHEIWKTCREWTLAGNNQEHTGNEQGQGHKVMKCAAGVGMHVDMTALVSSCMMF